MKILSKIKFKKFKKRCSTQQGIKTKQILLKRGAPLLLICFAEVFKRIAVHHYFVISHDKNFRYYLLINTIQLLGNLIDISADW